MSRPSVFFDNVDELRNEYDWMYEFMSRMAESIRGNPDVHSLHDYVRKIEGENVKLRELVEELYPLADYGAIDSSELDRAHDLMRELGVEVGE